VADLDRVPNARHLSSPCLLGHLASRLRNDLVRSKLGDKLAEDGRTVPNMSQWDLRALETFNAVVQAGGIGRAARALERPKATLSRQVRELEDSLGVRLFDRDSRMLTPTAEGRLLHERTRAALHELAEVR